jgi:transposase
MRKIREVLRLRCELGCTHRQIAAACSVSPATVSDYLARALRAGLGWQQAQSLSEAEVEAKLFVHIGRSEPDVRSAVDFPWVHRELRRHGVTLQLLWSDYRVAAQQAARRPYQYSQFCDLYAAWRGQQRLSMRQTHRPGEKLFVDYSGKRPSVTDPVTGEQREVELYVAVLGASNYTFAEVTFSQTVPDFTASTVRALEYFGASPKIVVPDQLRSAVARPDRYDPDINQTFNDLAQHYDMVVIPAPPRKPKGKAKVEVGVQIAQRWILARLRNRAFFSLVELNNAVSELVDELNERPFQKLEGNRQEAFETIDRPAMRALPALRFEVAERKKVRANIDYHVEFDGRYYSVPHQLRQQHFELRATPSIVELWHRGARIVSHRRSYGRKGTPITLPEHRPKSHEDYGQWPPERLIGWAASFGAHVEEVVRRTLAQYPQPEMGYRPVLGIIRCAQKHGAERMDAACLRALSVAGQSAPHRKSIEGIIKRGLDSAAPQTAPVTPRSTAHEHVRGPSYFDKEEDSDARRNHKQTNDNETPHSGQGSEGDHGITPG